MKPQSSPVYQTDIRTGETVRIDNVTSVAAPAEEHAVRRVDAVSSGSALSGRQRDAMQLAPVAWQTIPLNVGGRTISSLIRRKLIEHRYPAGMSLTYPLNWGEWRLKQNGKDETRAP